MANKKKFSFFGGKEEKKGIQYEVRDQVNPDPVEAKRIEKLNKEIEKNLRPVNDHEKIDLVTGQIYKDDHTDQKPKIKEKGQMWSPSFFKKEISAKPIAKPIIRKNKISSKLLIVCIEITYPMEALERKGLDGFISSFSLTAFQNVNTKYNGIRKNFKSYIKTAWSVRK